MYKRKILSSGIFFLYFLLPGVSVAQSMRDIKLKTNNTPQIIVDYGEMVNKNTRVPLADDLISQAVMGRLNGIDSAVFDVTYVNFSTEQETAFQYAVDIWSGLLQSDVVINITAQMASLGTGVIGQTAIPVRYANFDNAQKINSFYTVAVAEKMAGHDLNEPGEAEIIMIFNSDFDFYYGTNGNTPNGTHDFATIVLHEIGHGLGFSDGTIVNGGTGIYTVFGLPTVYDRYLENGSGDNIVDTFNDNSSELADQLTGDDLFFNSFLFPNMEDRPKLYAPATFTSGSSIAHLDEDAYPDGHVNSLMTPQIGQAESIHNPGISYEIFQDIGWVAMDIDFNRLFDSEDSLSNKTITALVQGDSAVIAGGVNLHYTYSDFNSEVIVNMTPTINANEYTADILATDMEELVKYAIKVDSRGGKVFTSPGEAPEFYWQFAMAKDTIAPSITHNNISVVQLNDLIIPISATIRENIGVGDLDLIYRINGGATDTIKVPLISSDIDGAFQGEYFIDWDLNTLGAVAEDVVEYRLSIQDIAASPNVGVHPTQGFHSISIIEINTPVAFYTNNFNSPTNDFVGSGFTIGTEVNFDSQAIHSNHPYRVVDGTVPGDSITLTFMLKTPIILSDDDASLIFDEVLLNEPGAPGTGFGHSLFWDYVIVDGSKNLGVDWSPLVDGYDSRLHEAWLTQWESNIVGNNSLAEGDKSLFIEHEINMTGNGVFAPGDTILIRFRLYADQLAHGWGWAIDNLKIQVDEKPPVITQITPDYMFPGTSALNLRSRVVDNIALDSVIYEIEFNGSSQLISFQAGTGLYSIDLGFTQPITTADILKYRIIAVDKAPNPNTSILPSVGFFEIPVVVLETARNMYVNDFDIASDDFIGANFSVRQDANFNTPSLISSTPYPDAPFETSDFSYLLKFPIILNEISAKVQYDEMVLTQPGADKVAFEVSKDGGTTWIAVIDEYDASIESSWTNLFNSFDSEGNSIGFAEPQFIVQRNFDILDNPLLSGGDEVLVRFRMTVNSSVHGYGWFIDNLEIQGIATGIEEVLNADIHVFPNPTSGILRVTGDMQGNNSRIIVRDLLGKVVDSSEEKLINNTLQTTLNLQHLKKGIYILSIISDQAYYTSRIVID